MFLNSRNNFYGLNDNHVNNQEQKFKFISFDIEWYI